MSSVRGGIADLPSASVKLDGLAGEPAGDDGMSSVRGGSSQLPNGSAKLDGLPGEAAGPAAASAGTGAPAAASACSGAPRGSRLGWVRRSPYFRRGVQCGLGTAFIVGLCSPPAISQALTVSSPSQGTLSPAAFVLVNYFFALLIPSTSGQSPLQVGAQQLLGCLTGGAVALAVMFTTYALNGASYQDSLAKALVMILLSAVVLFCMTVCRFHFRQYSLLFLFQSITYAMTTTSHYHTAANFYEFVWYWWSYAAIGSVVAFIISTLVLPITAGSIVRRRLAAALQHTARVAVIVLDVASGEVRPGTGLLAAANGETAQRIGIDGGLYPRLEPLFRANMAASQTFRDAYNMLPFAPHWVELYRRQRRFPRRAFWLLTIIGRSFLNAVLMMVYPIQTGTLHVALVARHRRQLMALGDALADTCDLLGDVLVQNAPVSGALEGLRVLEARYASLAAAARFKGSTMTQDAVALDLVLSICFTAVTRLRRMTMLLPEVLGADQPASLAPVLEHFQSQAGSGDGGHWSFVALTQVPAKGQGSGGAQLDPIEQLRASLLAAQPRKSMSRAARAMLAPPEVLELPHVPAHTSACLRAAHWLPGLLGVSPKVFVMALQMVTAYTVVLAMMVVPAVDNAFNQSLNWCLFVVVSVIEQSTGAALFKGVQRVAGALLFACLGVATQYFVYLCNGLSYANGPLKSCAMAASLAVLAFGAAAGGVRYPRYSYVFIIGAVTLGLTALPGFNGDSPEPHVALWRGINTLLGVAMEALAVTLILPVTARQCFTDLMADTLEQIATTASTAFEGALPRPLRSASRMKRSLPQHSLSQKTQRWWQRWGPPTAPAEQAPPLAPRRSREEQRQQVAAAAAAEEEAHGAGLRPRQPRQQQEQQQEEAGVGSGSPQAPAGSPPAGIEMSSGTRLVLAPVRTGRTVGQQQQQQQQQPTLALQQAASPPLSPLGSAGSSAQRRRLGGSGLTADSLMEARRQSGQSGQSPLHRLERSQSLSSDTSAHLSIYMSSGRDASIKIIGSGYAAQLPDLMSTADRIVSMFQLRTALEFEWYPLSDIHRFPFEPGFRAQRLCRHMLNVVASVPILMDSHEVTALPMLAPFAKRLHLLVEQLAVCLEAMAGMVRREHPPHRVVELVLALEEHVQRLLLLVLNDLGESSAGGGAPPESEVIVGLAYLAVICNAAYVVRLLTIALIRTFYAADAAAAKSEEALLLHAQRWSLDDRMMNNLTGILGVAIGSSASGSGGPMTPRLVTPRGLMTPRPRSREGSAHAATAAGAAGAGA